MAYIANPYNLDDDDDAVFSALLSEGLIWVEEDDEDYDSDDVLEEARDFLGESDMEWVNFSHLCQHLHEVFYELDPKRLWQSDKKYKSLIKFFADHPSDFEIRQDGKKQGLYFIRLNESICRDVDVDLRPLF